MSKYASLLITALAVLCCVASTTQAQEIIDNLTTYEIELPITLSGEYSSWRIWGLGRLSPRLFQGMDTNNNFYIGCTSNNSDGYVFKVKYDTAEIISQHKFEDHHIRGLYVHPDGSFGALLWNQQTSNISVAKVDVNNNEVWRSELYHNYAVPTDFGIGDSRLEYGNGEYRAYYHVHGVSSFAAGHEGDAYYVVNDTGYAWIRWSWGCSHPMSNLLRFHPDTNATLAVCASDAYPGHGIYTENSNYIYTTPANERGCVSCEIGGLEIGFNGTWALVFNALQPERKKDNYDLNKDNQDIGIAFIGRNKQKTSLKFLTKTKKINEEDGCISLVPGTLASGDPQYLVGWKSGSDYLLSVVDSKGDYLINQVNVTGYTKWGSRDDSFRTYENDGSIYWVYAPDSKGSKVVITKLEITTVSASSFYKPLSFLFSLVFFVMFF